MRVKMTSKMSAHERREIEKFTRFLALKATQVIVQSRLGEKISTSCNPHSTVSDWFNLSIHDLPDVQSEAKKALGAQMLTIGLNLCVEISLKTVEGDMLVLETWSLGIREEVDQTNRVPYSVYNRMSLLLKSLIAATRVTPAYKLSCRQGPDSYVICYRVYMGEPQFYLLGEGYQQARVGEVGTPMGTITLSVMYRTKMTISPQKTSRDCPITSMMKSDYFKPDMSPKQLHCYSNAVSPDPRSPSMDIPNNKLFSNHDTNGQTRTEVASPNCVKEHINGVNDKENVESINGFMDLPDHKRLGAFAPSSKDSDISPYLLPETSFLTVLKEDLQKSKLITKEPESLSTTPDTKVGTESNSSGTGTRESNGTQTSVGSDGSASDDFVLVELKPPFADCEGNGDLGAFFRDFQMAPPLVSFAQQPTLEEQVNEIRNQLAELETSAEDLDNFVDSLCMVETLK